MLKISLLFFIYSCCAVGTGKAGSIYAVVVGISDYKYAVPRGQPGFGNLNYSDDDAVKFTALLKSLGVPGGNIITLINSDATYANITQSLAHVFPRASADDMVMFFFSGHGGPGFFTTYDIDVNNERNFLYHQHIKLAFKSSPARVKFCFADACYSGGIKSKEAGKSIEVHEDTDLSATTEGKGTEKANSANIVVMMSSRADEVSMESSEVMQGYFAYHLIRGMAGKADSNSDKIVTISELYKYVRHGVQKSTSKKQTPITFGKFNPNLTVVGLR